MRISDWSSDVCSSDLLLCAAIMSRKQCPLGDEPWRVRDIQFDDPQVGVGASAPVDIGGAGRRIGRFIGADRFPYITAGQRESPFEQRAENGRASCRGRVLQYV